MFSSSQVIKVAKKVVRKKKQTKKQAQKRKAPGRKPAQRKVQKPSSWPFIIGVLMLVVAIVGIVVLLRKAPSPGAQAQTGKVLVTVNGEPITEHELQLRKALAPAALQGSVDDQLLEILIAEKLLTQKAAEEGVAATDADVDKAIKLLLEQGGLSKEDLANNLAAFNMTEEEFRSMIQQQLSIIKLLNQTLDDKVAVNDAEVAQYYDEHLDQFFTQGTATVKHILMPGGDETTSEEEARQAAEDVLQRYENGADFCELVKEHSIDTGSIEKCGEYTFPKGVMVPEFEAAAFSMKPNETRIVQTQYGFHIILKVDEAPGRQLTLEETAPAIRQELERQKQLAAYEAFIQELRDAATITYVAAEAPEEAPEPAESEPLGEQDEAAPASEDFASCVGRKATLYTASWDTASQEQLALFGEDIDKLTVVECTANKEACDAAGIEAYPTWVIGERQHLGKLSLDMLSQLTGCAR